MKSEDLQKVVTLKHQNGDYPTEIFRDLNGVLGLTTIKRWCKMIDETGFINLTTPPGPPRTVRTEGAIKKVKKKLEKGKVSTRKLALDLGMSRRSAQRILQNDLGCRSYKCLIEPALTEEHKEKRKKFANWIRTSFRKQETLKILFSDEKMFDIDGVYNSQNDRIWAASRDEADKKGGIHQKKKFPQKVMVWLGVCSKGVSPLVIFEQGTVSFCFFFIIIMHLIKVHSIMTDTSTRCFLWPLNMEIMSLEMIGHSNKMVLNPILTI